MTPFPILVRTMIPQPLLNVNLVAQLRSQCCNVSFYTREKKKKNERKQNTYLYYTPIDGYISCTTYFSYDRVIGGVFTRRINGIK